MKAAVQYVAVDTPATICTLFSEFILSMTKYGTELAGRKLRATSRRMATM